MKDKDTDTDDSDEELGAMIYSSSHTAKKFREEAESWENKGIRIVRFIKEYQTETKKISISFTNFNKTCSA